MVCIFFSWLFRSPPCASLLPSLKVMAQCGFANFCLQKSSGIYCKTMMPLPAKCPSYLYFQHGFRQSCTAIL